MNGEAGWWTTKTQDQINFKIISQQNIFSTLNTKPSRVTEHLSTLIDNIYCKGPELSTASEAGILCTSMSDHYSIFCTIKTETLSNNIHSLFKVSVTSIILFYLMNHGLFSNQKTHNMLLLGLKEY